MTAIMGTTTLLICPICEQYTVDSEGVCHNIDCSEDFIDTLVASFFDYDVDDLFV